MFFNHETAGEHARCLERTKHAVEKRRHAEDDIVVPTTEHQSQASHGFDRAGVPDTAETAMIDRHDVLRRYLVQELAPRILQEVVAAKPSVFEQPADANHVSLGTNRHKIGEHDGDAQVGLVSCLSLRFRRLHCLTHAGTEVRLMIEVNKAIGAIA